MHMQICFRKTISKDGNVIVAPAFYNALYGMEYTTGYWT